VNIDPLGVILAVSAGLLFLAFYFLLLNRWLRARQLAPLPQINFDQLDGPAFEKFVAEVLTRRGYRVQHTGKAGDLGVDLIAAKGASRFAVQVKRQAQPVSRHAVSDAVAGKAYYHCNAAMVVTNNIFSQGAYELARSNGCQLVDRKLLLEWLEKRS